MPEVVVRVEVPAELGKEFSAAFERLVNGLVRDWEFLVAKDIVARSELTSEQAGALALEIKKGMARRHGLM